MCGEKTNMPELKGMSVWITPACAGKSGRTYINCNSYEDHPRMCGEKADFPVACPRCRGSPPHVRGKVYQR